MLSKKQEKFLEKYCDNNILVEYRGIIKKMEQMDSVRIVNTGMVSSGKSSIYNSLIDSIEEEKFPTGAARTTMIADEFFYQNNIVFVDTPGIDVRTEDDEIAFQTVSSADLILMIHNVKTGELKKSEVEWIENLCSVLGSEKLRERFIFICSWVDERERDSDYDELIGTIKNMVFESVGGEVPVFETSAKRYQDGKVRGKQKLVERSGIDTLREYLLQEAVTILAGKEEQIAQERRGLNEKMSASLYQSRTYRLQKIEEIKKEVEERFQGQFREWKSVFSTYKTYKKTLLKLQEELEAL